MKPAALRLASCLVAALFVAAVVVACNGSPAGTSGPVEAAGGADGGAAEGTIVPCETPRPEVCTREYRPVCARVDTALRCVNEPCDGTVRGETAPNACEACADPAVTGWTAGACDAGNASAPPDQPDRPDRRTRIPLDSRNAGQDP